MQFGGIQREHQIGCHEATKVNIERYDAGLGLSRCTLLRFLERGHVGHAEPPAVLNSVGGNTAALEPGTLDSIIDLEGYDRTLRPGLEESPPAAVCHDYRHHNPRVTARRSQRPRTALANSRLASANASSLHRM